MEMFSGGTLLPREIRVILQPGQRFPAKRGTPITMSFKVFGESRTIEGVVRFRRLNVGVIDGHIRLGHAATA